MSSYRNAKLKDLVIKNIIVVVHFKTELKQMFIFFQNPKNSWCPLCSYMGYVGELKPDTVKTDEQT